MKYKLLAIDLDGTLLMEDLTIPQEVIDAIHTLMDTGVIVTIATGRAYPTVKQIATQIGITAPLICYNGALVKTVDGVLHHEGFLTRKMMNDIIDCGRRMDWYLQLYDEQGLVVDRITDDTLADPDFHTVPCREVGPLHLADLPLSPKIMTRCDPSEVAFRTAVLDRATGGQLYMAASSPHLVEMMRRETGKAPALTLLCKELGIDPSEVVVCGDSGNDLDMVAFAGVGCAMANATPALKEIANYICKAERSYGVLEVIQKLIQQECFDV